MTTPEVDVGRRQVSDALVVPGTDPAPHCPWCKSSGLINIAGSRVPHGNRRNTSSATASVGFEVNLEGQETPPRPYSKNVPRNEEVHEFGPNIGSNNLHR